MLKKSTIAYIVIAVISLSVGGLGGYLLYMSTAQPNEEVLSLIDRFGDLERGLERYKTEQGKQVAEVKAVTVTKRDLARSNSELAKELEQQIGEKLKQLEASVDAEVTSTGEGPAVVIRNFPRFDSTDTADTVPDTLRYRDGYLDLDAELYLDSANVKYSYNARYRVNTYWKTKGLFKRDVLVTQVVPENPKAYVTGARSIVATPARRRKWVLPLAGGVVLGIGATIGIVAAVN